MYFSSVSSRLLMYDINSWDLKKSYGCYDGLMRDMSWSDDGKYILQVNSKGLIEILTPFDHEVRCLQHIPIKDTWSASFHRDGHKNIAIGTKSGNVMIWDTKNKNITKTFPAPSHQSCVNHISYNSRNSSLAATTQNGDTVIYGLVSNIPALTVKLSCSKSISAMKFHHETRSMLGLATDEGHVVIRDITTNKDKVFFENIHASPVSDFVYSLINKDVLLSCGYDKIMHVYDIRLQNVVSTIRTPYTLTSLAINLENEVALGTKNGLVLIYDLRDLTNPYKILKGHDEEVRKVSFQPTKRKSLSTEISLREDTETNLTTHKVQSPVRTRTSDMFYITDTPPSSHMQVPGQAGDSKADSFLVMMGLDGDLSSHNDFDDDQKKSNEFERISDKHETRFRHLDVEKNLSKASTPMNNNVVPDSFGFASPVAGNGVGDELRPPNINLSAVKQSNCNVATPIIDSKTMEELKDFIKLTVSDVGDDCRNSFLHIMMALTKQKMFFEKKLLSMNEKIEHLVHNQNTLMETNIKLILEINQLKAQNKNLENVNQL